MMEYVHPLPDASISQRQPSQYRPSDSPTTPTKDLSKQARLLQLRNAGFRGVSILPGVRNSPPSVVDTFLRPFNHENSPRSSERRILYGEDSPPNEVNILREIRNSTDRKCISSDFGVIFQDSTETGQADGEIERLWWGGENSNCSPSNRNGMPVISTLRERSENQMIPTPTLSSHCQRAIRDQKLNRVNTRSTSAEAAKYIEHLESQLTAANTKLDSFTTPAASQARSTKIRALTEQSRNLRREVSGWENNFVERVKGEIDQYAKIEAELRSRLQSLKNELQSKDVKMRGLEWELDIVRARLREAEGLQEINLNLEKRIDVLTSLLVLSPTKLDQPPASFSPSKADPLKRGHRPRSMVPAVPSSPGGVRLSLNTNIETSFGHYRHFDSASSISYFPSEISRSVAEDDREHSPEYAAGTQFDSSSRTSASFSSMPSTRPTSLQSDSSLGLQSPVALPLPVDLESQANSAMPQRKMRRFPSGSCTLKPLILPKTAVTASFPASAPLHTFLDLQLHDISGNPVDPLTAFLSRSDLSSPPSTPDASSRRRSATWTQHQTVKALEGKLRQAHEPYEQFSAHQPSPISEMNFDPDESKSSESSEPRRRPLSLYKELALSIARSPNLFQGGLIPAAEAEVDLEAVQDPQCESPSSPFMRQRSWTTNSELTPKQNKTCSHVDLAPSFMPSRPTATNNTLDILTRLISLISRAKQDPVLLARRLLYNAWTLGSARLGGIAWWLLGLGFRSHRQRGLLCAANEKAVEENPAVRLNWHHFSAPASRARTADFYLRDQVGGGEYKDTPVELSHLQTSSGSSTSGPTPNATFTMVLAPRHEPHLFPCDDCAEPSSHRTFRLWFHFSLAIVLAVGVAIKEGPGILLIGRTSPPNHVPPPQLEGQESLRSRTDDVNRQDL